jgi:integrase
LGALRRDFNFAARAGLAERPMFPSIAVSNARQGFFERDEWHGIREHLEPEFQDVGDLAYLTGWRMMEVLSLRWHQVTAGTLRLEPGTTKTGAGRSFPFADYPELAAVIARRAAKRDELQKSEMRIIPSVFFLSQEQSVSFGW